MAIDPIVLATITSAVTVLGNEYLKDIASEAGKSTWAQLKSLFGWTSDPSPADLASGVAAKLLESPELVSRILDLLNAAPEVGTAAMMVGKINAEKVVVAHEINTDTFQM